MKKILFLITLSIGINCFSKNKPFFSEDPNDSLQVTQKSVKNYENGVLQNEEIVLFSYENNLVSKIVTTIDGIVSEEVTITYKNGKLKEMNVQFNDIKFKRNNSIITQYGSATTVLYNYVDDKIVSCSKKSNGLERIHYFTYNENAQLIREEENENGNIIRKTKYSYDSNDNLTKESNLTDKEYFYYKSYDDKKNSFSLIYPIAYRKVHKLSKNNIKSSFLNGNSFDYEYEYNSSNYPTKIRIKKEGKICSETIIKYTNKSF